MSFIDAKAIIACLEANSYEARYIGGCVRDKLLSRPINDIDIATTSEPQETKHILGKAGFKIKPGNGEKFGTVLVIQNKTLFEVTTLRQDQYQTTRHPIVIYTKDLQHDAERRDFTINALSLDSQNRIHDYTNGQQDLKDKIVRFIGNPSDRIKEDPLRILRYFRFLTSYQDFDRLDPTSLTACIQYQAELKALSGHRVRYELLKLVDGAKAIQILELLKQHNLVQSVFRCDQLDNAALEYLISNNLTHNPFLKFLSLLPVFTKDFWLEWPLSKYEKKLVTSAQDQITTINITQLKKYGLDMYKSIVLLTAARQQLDPVTTRNHLNDAEAIINKQLPINGHDLLNHTDLAPMQLKDALNQATDYWYETGFTADKADLLKYLSR